jgi:hypothetical protein
MDQEAGNRHGPIALFARSNDDINVARCRLACVGQSPFLNTVLAATGVSGAKRIKAMATLKTEEEGILTFDVSDEALEIAGSVSDKANFT